ncbi:MAG: cytochrome b N-terminal domain-containing protein [Pirellulales bacterium]
MWNKTLAWLNDRTGYRRLRGLLGQRVLPEGPSWARTTAACVLWLLLVELATGLLLMTMYSPSMASAWASIFYLEQLPGGAFLRGLHYFGGQALIIAFAVHAIRVLLSGAYRAPRELVWVTGLMLIPPIIVWAVTGNPLSATQKGVAQIDVEGNIVASTPVVGPVAREILIGGDQVGNLTITHLYFLHVALLPIVVVLLTMVHVWQLYRNSPVRLDENSDQAVPYWPYQSARNAFVCSIVLAVVALLAWRYGAPLDAPADPGIDYIPRPEWYFLCLFELRRYFTGDWEFIATQVIPALVLLLLLVMPLVEWLLPRRASATVRYLVVIAGVVAWAGLTFVSLVRDRDDAKFQASRQEADELARRARVLAVRGVPPQGAVALLRHDPKTRGRQLFAQHCASCHPWTDGEGHGIACEDPTAPNLYGFASRTWVADVLDPDKFASARLFGKTKHRDGDMADGVTDDFEEAQIPLVVAALSAEAQLPSQVDIDKSDALKITEGRKLMQNEDEGCVQCHVYHGVGDEGTAPDLTRYGSRRWLINFIRNPASPRFYGDENDRMPSFAEHPVGSKENQLDVASIELIARWLRGEWFEPSGDEESEQPGS